MPNALRHIQQQSLALQTLGQFQMVVMDEHFDFGNGYHGTLYIMPDRIRARPARAVQLIRELAQEVLTADVIRETEVVLGPARGGIQLAAYMTKELETAHWPHYNPAREDLRYIEKERGPDGEWRVPERYLDDVGEDGAIIDGPHKGKKPVFLQPPFCAEAVKDREGKFVIPDYFRTQVIPGRKVLIVDDVKNTGETLFRCVEVVRAAGGIVLATAVIYDRLHEQNQWELPSADGKKIRHFALTQYEDESVIWPVGECPLCRLGKPIYEFVG